MQLLAVCRGWVIKDQPREGKPPQRGSIKTGVLIDVESTDVKDNLLQGLTLPMEEAGAVEVTVKHSDGSPAQKISVAASPNQMLEDTGTQTLGECFPSLRIIESRLDPSIVPVDPWQSRPHSRYQQETDETGKATLYDLPFGTWSIYVGNEEFTLVTEKDQDNLYPEVKVKIEKAETLPVTVRVKPITDVQK